MTEEAAGGFARRKFLVGGAVVGASALAAACTTSKKTPDAAASPLASTPATETTAAVVPGKPVTIGFAGPIADHGWLNAVNAYAKAEAKKFSDVTLKITEGSNDAAVQSGQIETLINDKVDVLVILPADGKAQTQMGKKAMDAGIPVINLDRIFDTPLAYRTWIGGDNYGMGVSAGNYIGEALKGKADAKVVELAGLDVLELTQQRSAGFKAALANYPNIKLVGRQAAEFTVESGQAKMAQLLQAYPDFDALWNHDDDQGIGAEQAIKQAGRSNFLMVGGAGSKHAMETIKADDSPLKATVLYSPTMAASAIRLARILAQGNGMEDLFENEIPSSITLFSAVVTKNNVDQYMPAGFE